MRGVLTLFKTPSLWFEAFAVLATVEAVQARAMADGGLDYSLHATYYIVAHFHYGLSVSAWFLICGVFYLLFRRIFGVGYNEALGRIHFGLTFAGALMMSLPWAVLNLEAMPKRGFDFVGAFALWSAISSIGYVMTLLGSCVLIVVVVDAVRRRRAYARDRNER